MIPAFVETGLLPNGIHWADINEIRSRFALNECRRRLMRGLERALGALKNAGCQTIYLDGSFVCKKEFPSDYDACWEAIGVNIISLDTVFLEFSNRRAAQKAKYCGEFFPSHFQAEAKSPYRTYLDFFQSDKNTGKSKGIIGIKL